MLHCFDSLGVNKSPDSFHPKHDELRDRSSQLTCHHSHVIANQLPAASASPSCPAGEMSDASELLMVLYEHLKAAGKGTAGDSVDDAFGLRVAEGVTCSSCGKETHANRYTQVGVRASYCIAVLLLLGIRCAKGAA